MTYLTSQDFIELLAHEEKIRVGVLKISDFEDQSDRTLTVGISGPTDDPSRSLYEHIYIEGGQLRRHAYLLEAGNVHTRIQTASDGIHVLLLRPVLGVAPSATDLEFAKLMAEFHQPLHFFEPDSEEDKMLSKNRVDGEFFGWRQKYYFENGNSTLY